MPYECRLISSWTLETKMKYLKVMKLSSLPGSHNSCELVQLQWRCRPTGHITKLIFKILLDVTLYKLWVLMCMSGWIGSKPTSASCATLLRRMALGKSRLACENSVLSPVQCLQRHLPNILSAIISGPNWTHGHRCAARCRSNRKLFATSARHYIWHVTYVIRS